MHDSDVYLAMNCVIPIISLRITVVTSSDLKRYVGVNGKLLMTDPLFELAIMWTGVFFAGLLAAIGTVFSCLRGSDG